MKHSVNTECSVISSIHCSKEQQTCARSYPRTVAAAKNSKQVLDHYPWTVAVPKNSKQVLDHTCGLSLQQRIANKC